ncbi:MAG: hypothetical protein V1835_03470 [Candidatus Micrarchaeota archaeon]
MDRPTGVTVAAVLIGIIGILGLLGSVLMFAGGAIFGAAGASMGGTVTATGEDGQPQQVDMGLFGGLFGGAIMLIAAVTLVISILEIYSAYSLTQGKPWARIACAVFGALSLLNFPLGTIVGLVVLYFLYMDQASKQYFEGMAAAVKK